MNLDNCVGIVLIFISVLLKCWSLWWFVCWGYFCVFLYVVFLCYCLFIFRCFRCWVNILKFIFCLLIFVVIIGVILKILFIWWNCWFVSVDIVLKIVNCCYFVIVKMLGSFLIVMVNRMLVICCWFYGVSLGVIIFIFFLIWRVVRSWMFLLMLC